MAENPPQVETPIDITTIHVTENATQGADIFMAGVDPREQAPPSPSLGTGDVLAESTIAHPPEKTIPSALDSFQDTDMSINEEAPTIAAPLEKQIELEPEVLSAQEQAPVPQATSLPAPISETVELQEMSTMPSRVPAAPTETLPATNHDRPLNVNDALSYLDKVKDQFSEAPEVYNRFLDIMKDFKSHLIDTPGVIKRVSQLFDGHPSLIQGFNTFLPVGYLIECTIGSDGMHVGKITVTTPTGTMICSDDGRGWAMSDQSGVLTTPNMTATPVETALSVALAQTGLPQYRELGLEELESSPDTHPALNYVNIVKNTCNSPTYAEFIYILEQWKIDNAAIGVIGEESKRTLREVLARIKQLFGAANHPELIEHFKVFIPDSDTEIFDEFLAMKDRKRKRIADVPVINTSNTSGKRKRKPTEREKDKELTAKATNGSINKKSVDIPSHSRPAHDISRQTQQSAQPQHPSSSHRHHQATPVHHQPPPPHAPPLDDETQFFPLVKQFFSAAHPADHGLAIYAEFLRLINCFTQGYIDTATLLHDCAPFLGAVDGELMSRFREILGWDDEREREKMERDRVDEEIGAWVMSENGGVGGVGRRDQAKLYGSYRRLPATDVQPVCSGRDDMCRSVLNDEWVSHPTWTSEDPGYTAHKKNLYEEALHRSEEERHEYDFHVDALSRTLTMLEPFAHKINLLPADERPGFKLKANLAGSAKSIHYRVIKKIYGREIGLEVIQAMQDAPAQAIPVVFNRLKKKEEEWKRAQKEWNKVWRASDAKNYHKSLDHQGVVFKATDKKATTARFLLSQVEAARDEQRAERASLIDPLYARTKPRHHLEFQFEDLSVLQDALKLTFSFLDRVQAQISHGDRRKVESVLRAFVPLFFLLDMDTFNQAFAIGQEVERESEVHDDVGTTTEDVEMASTIPSSNRSARITGHRKNMSAGGGDLRKKLLKSEQAKVTGSVTPTPRKTRGQDVIQSAFPSRANSPAHLNMTGVNLLDWDKQSYQQNIFFANSTWYVLLRLLQMLSSRLSRFKSLSTSLSADLNKASSLSSEALEDASLAQYTAEYHYDLMLQACERLFDNELEQSAFEEQMREVFGSKEAYQIFTVDKVIGAILKQVQIIISDVRSQDLLELLRRERLAGSYSVQELFRMRQAAEDIIGPEEPLFRIDWRRENKLTVELVGSNSTLDDSETLIPRWKSYITQFVSNDILTGNPNLRRPFLRKSLPKSPESHNASFHAGLQVKICLATYKMFYVPGTEDWLRRDFSSDASREIIRRKDLRRRRWVQDQLTVMA